MPGFLSNLLQGAAAGRSAYLEGEYEAENDRKLEQDRKRRIREEMVRMALLDLQKKKAEKDLNAPEPSSTVSVSGGRPGRRVSADLPADNPDAIARFLDRYGADEPPPALSPAQQRLRGNDQRRRAEDMVDDLVAAGHPTYVIDQELKRAGLDGAMTSSEIHGRYMKRLNKQHEGDEGDEGGEAGEERYNPEGLTMRELREGLPTGAPEQEERSSGGIGARIRGMFGGGDDDQPGAPTRPRSAQPGAPAPQLPEALQGAAGLVRGMETTEARALLEQAGYDAEEIDQILGAR